MPAAFPVPVYTTTTQIGGSADKRVLSSTSPGTSDSTATSVSVGLGSTTSRLRPEQTGSGGDSVPSSGQIAAVGWGYAVDDLVADEFDTTTISAGTWTFPLHHSRPGGLLTSNISVSSVTAILSRVEANPSAGASLEEIGRTTTGSFTITTSEQVQTINITGVQFTANAGERIWLEVYATYALHITSDIARYHTNSTTALRLTAAPGFTLIRSTVGTASGTGTASGELAATKGTIGASTSSTTVSGSLGAFKGVVGVSTGTPVASGMVASVQPTVGTAAGSGAADAVVAAIAQTVGTASGQAQSSAVVAAIAQTVGSAEGSSASSASLAAVKGTVGGAAGSSSAEGKPALIVPTVGTVNVSEGGGETTVHPVFGTFN